jgi:flagellar biosynthesis protein FliP
MTRRDWNMNRSGRLSQILARMALVLVVVACGVPAATADEAAAIAPVAPAAIETTSPVAVAEPVVEAAPEADVAGDEPISATGPETDEESPSAWPFGQGGPAEWTSPEGLSTTIRTLLLLTVVSLAPAVLMMTTCFVRIVVVLSVLRQALGTAQLPSGQVITSLALFMTLLVMSPVWNQVYQDAVVPYTSHEITLDEACQRGVQPVRQFMSAQIDRTGNSGDVWLFYKYLPQPAEAPSSYDDVPLTVLLPAFMLSELKTAFLIGFQVYLPFLVIDLVVASVTISMGMVMLPPVMVSLPLKLLLFVLVDGWHLVVGMLLDSFQTFSAGGL